MKITVNLLGIEKTFVEPSEAAEWITEVLEVTDPQDDEVFIFGGLGKRDEPNPGPNGNQDPVGVFNPRVLIDIVNEALDYIAKQPKTGARQ